MDAVRRRFSLTAWIWLLVAAAYFLIPLIATLLFSLKDDQTGKCCSLGAYGFVLHDHQFWTTIRVSFVLSLETIAISLLLFVPTIYWVHLKVPRLRPVLGFLVAAYVILAFPYMYFALDAGFRAIPLHTLTEASQSLGANWRTTLGRVILPNIRVAALGGSFLTLAIVMGEFTIASLSAFNTFPTYIQLINESKAYEAAALSLMSFGITWAAMLALLLVGRGRPGRPVQIAGAR